MRRKCAPCREQKRNRGCVRGARVTLGIAQRQLSRWRVSPRGDGQRKGCLAALFARCGSISRARIDQLCPQAHRKSGPRPATPRPYLAESEGFGRSSFSPRANNPRAPLPHQMHVSSRHPKAVIRRGAAIACQSSDHPHEKRPLAKSIRGSALCTGTGWIWRAWTSRQFDHATRRAASRSRYCP